MCRSWPVGTSPWPTVCRCRRPLEPTLAEPAENPTTPPADADAARWAVEAARAADDKLGEETVVLEVGAVLAVTEHFVITHGRNARQVRTIAEEVEHRLTTLGGPKPIRIEGLDDLTWVLLDYGEFVVHVFDEDARRYYELERLWADVPSVDWSAST